MGWWVDVEGGREVEEGGREGGREVEEGGREGGGSQSERSYALTFLPKVRTM